MSDEPLPLPPRVPVTPAWLAEQDAKHAAYMEQRRRHMLAIEGHSDDQAVPQGEPVNSFRRFNLGRKRRITRRREDPEQLSFSL